MDLLKGFHGEFAWFIWGLVGLGLIWFFTGGTASPSAHEGQYIEPLAPLDDGDIYGTYYEGGDIKQDSTLNLPQTPGNLLRKAFFAESKEAQEIHATTILAKKISFEDFARARESNPDQEYVRIVVSKDAKESYRLSGLVLKGTAKNVAIIIPKAANLPVLATSPIRTDVYLPPGGHAIVSTGRSPIGTSFRVNKCMAYLEQFQNFFPDFQKNCPLPVDDLKAHGPYTDAACLGFIEEIPRCQIYQGAPPKNLHASCINFLAGELNYNACVANHKNDKDFYVNEWRIFLNQPKELWANRDEIIRLVDKDTVLDAITY